MGIIQRIRDRASVAQNRRLRVAQLEQDLRAASTRHSTALAEHKAACDRYHADPTEENRDATWSYYNRTWECFNEVFAIWRKLREESRTAS